MKKNLIFLVVAIAIFFVSACENNKKNESNDFDQTPTPKTCQPTLINLLTFRDQSLTTSSSVTYTYSASVQYNILDAKNATLYKSPNIDIKQLTSSTVIAMDFSKMTGVTAAADNNIVFNVTINRTDNTRKVETETFDNKATPFVFESYTNALGGSLEMDNKNNITIQSINFYFGKKGTTLPGNIQPPIKPIVTP